MAARRTVCWKETLARASSSEMNILRGNKFPAPPMHNLLATTAFVSAPLHPILRLFLSLSRLLLSTSYPAPLPCLPLITFNHSFLFFFPFPTYHSFYLILPFNVLPNILSFLILLPRTPLVPPVSTLYSVCREGGLRG